MVNTLNTSGAAQVGKNEPSFSQKEEGNVVEWHNLCRTGYDEAGHYTTLMRKGKISLWAHDDGTITSERYNYSQSILTESETEEMLEAITTSNFYDSSEKLTQGGDDLAQFLSNQAIQVFKEHDPSLLLNNKFKQGSIAFTDHERRVVIKGEDDKILLLSDPAKKIIYVPLGYVKENNITLPEQKESYHGDIENAPDYIKAILEENQVENLNIDTDEMDKRVLLRMGNESRINELVKEIEKVESRKEKVEMIKERYGISGGTFMLPNVYGNCAFDSKGGVVKVFQKEYKYSYSDIYKLLEKYYIKKEERVDSDIKEGQGTVEIIGKDGVQLGIFSREQLIPSVSEENEKIQEEAKVVKEIKQEEKVDKVQEEMTIEEGVNPIRAELKKKFMFGLIKENGLGPKVLLNQPNKEDYTKLVLDSLNTGRKFLNDNSLFKAPIGVLRELYNEYDLGDIEGENSEFRNIFTSLSRDYIKAAFQTRIDKIADRINTEDTPSQSLEEYYHDIRMKQFDFAAMNTETFQKTVRAMTLIFRHDLTSSSMTNIKETHKYINPFMRQAKSYIKDKGLSFDLINSVLPRDFLILYKKSLSA